VSASQVRAERKESRRVADQMEVEYFVPELNKRTRLPGWVVRRPEFWAVLNQDAHSGDLQVREALRTVPPARSGKQLALLAGWLR